MQVEHLKPGAVIHLPVTKYDGRDKRGYGPQYTRLPATVVIVQSVSNGVYPAHKCVSLLELGERMVVQDYHLPFTMEVESLRGAAKKQLLAEAKLKQRELGLQMLTSATTYRYWNGKLGSDPEIFLEENGQLLPAFEVLPAKKEGLSVHTNNGPESAYWDGFQAEMTTYAAECLAWQCDSVHYGLQTILKHVRKTHPYAKFSIKTVVQIPQDLMAKAKPEHVALGCMPSLNVYNTKGAIPPDGRHLPLRFAGGHMHFAGTHAKVEIIIKTLDRALGIPLVAMMANFDMPHRRQFYGLAGEHRLPPHGVEYRTPSNAWMFHPVIMNLTFEVGRAAVRFANSPYASLLDAPDAKVQEIINTCDVAQAKKYMDSNKELLVALMGSWCTYGSGGQPIFDAFYNGMESIIADPTDIEKNWMLDGGWTNHCDGPQKNWTHSYQDVAKGRKV